MEATFQVMTNLKNLNVMERFGKWNEPQDVNT